MKEKSSLCSSCETAAVRVQCWFGKDKANLLQLNSPSTKFQDFCTKYKCDLLKAPRIPIQVDNLPLQQYVLAKKRKQTKTRCVSKENPSKPLGISLDSSYCNVSQKNLNHMTSENALSSARVGYCKLKEHFLVSKRLKNMGKQQNTGPKRHQVVPIKSWAQEDLSQNPYIQEWEKVKEERHFQIGRVIKYLVD